MVPKIISTIYLTLLIKSTGRRNFSEMGRLINKPGVEVSKKLESSEEIFSQLEKIAKKIFVNKKKLSICIDESSLQKPHSKSIQGTGYFYDTKAGRMFHGFKGVFAVITDGKVTIPISLTFLMDQKVCDFEVEKLSDITKKIILWALKIFDDKELDFIFDGSYSSKEMLEWLIAHNITATLRMHSNRTIRFTKPSEKETKKEAKEKLFRLTECQKLQLKGRRMSKTILTWWHGLQVYITAHKRIDKNNNESVVYLVSTFKAKSSIHVKTYQRRWNIEKMFRTSKQYLGLKDCQSTNLEKQKNHMASVLLAYAFLQIEMKKHRLNSPEEALRRLKTKNVDMLIKYLSASNQIFEGAYA